MTNQEDRQLLLRMARAAIVCHVQGTGGADSGCRDRPAPSEAAARPGAAFVTIHCRGELRGCIGHLDGTSALGPVIEDCAVAACSADPRFPPVTGSELSSLVIELSLLGPFERVTDTAEIEVGRHGLVVERDGRRGLLLPQVAAQWQWDRETFLAQTCRKAGLPRNAWKAGAGLWRFEAEVFGEDR